MFNIIKEHHQHLSDRDLLITILVNQFLILKTIEMNKTDFIQAITDLKTEVTGIGVKVDTLEAAINNSTTDVDPAIVAAFADLKSGVDSLNTKADNTPATVPAA